MAQRNLTRNLSVITIWSAFAVSRILSQSASPQNSAASPDPNANTKPLVFDVVSIKPNESNDPSGTSDHKPDGIYAVNIPLTTFLYSGFTSTRVYGAPGWLSSERYDFEAKVAESDLPAYQHASSAERDRMLRAVFEDRMKLKTHEETRQLPIYALVLAKNGSKLKVAPAATQEREPPPGAMNQGSGLYLIFKSGGERQIIGQGASMAGLTEYLSYSFGIDRFIADKTGLTGEYDFTLNWADPKDPDSSSLSIYTAIQEQLGLKLEPTKGPVEVLVIDHIERPTEN
jgi:uncharacterized protein (TIGR03435 family)